MIVDFYSKLSAKSMKFFGAMFLKRIQGHIKKSEPQRQKVSFNAQKFDYSWSPSINLLTFQS